MNILSIIGLFGILSLMSWGGHYLYMKLFYHNMHKTSSKMLDDILGKFKDSMDKESELLQKKIDLAKKERILNRKMSLRYLDALLQRKMLKADDLTPEVHDEIEKLRADGESDFAEKY